MHTSHPDASDARRHRPQVLSADLQPSPGGAEPSKGAFTATLGPDGKTFQWKLSLDNIEGLHMASGGCLSCF